MSTQRQQVEVDGFILAVTTVDQCPKSKVKHNELVRDARADRVAHGFDVESSYVVCGFCQLSLALK